MKTPIPPKLDTRQLMYLRAGGWLLVGAALVASLVWGGQYPAVNIIAAAVCGVVGKYLGLPVDAIIRYVLTRQPDKALSIAADALQKLPPAEVESATQGLLASLPPETQARVGVVLLKTASSAPPAPPTPPAP